MITVFLSNTILAMQRFVPGAIILDNFMRMVVAKDSMHFQTLRDHISHLLFHHQAYAICVIFLSTVIRVAKRTFELSLHNQRLIFGFHHFKLDTMSTSYLFTANHKDRLVG